MLKSWFVLFLCFTAFHGHGQRQLINGKVLAQDDLDIEGVNIFNLASGKGVVSDSAGAFSLEVGLGDTLAISSIQIKTTKLAIVQEHLNDKAITIHLSENRNELATVTLRRALSGYLGTDVNLIPITEPITASSLGLPNANVPQLTKTDRMLYAANSGPVDALLNMITGRTKMLKRRQELEETMTATQSLLEKFPETYFTDALGLGKFSVYSFIFFCESDKNYQQVMKGNTMEIISFLNKKRKEFQAQTENSPDK